MYIFSRRHDIDHSEIKSSARTRRADFFDLLLEINYHKSYCAADSSISVKLRDRLHIPVNNNVVCLRGLTNQSSNNGYDRTRALFLSDSPRY